MPSLLNELHSFYKNVVVKIFNIPDSDRLVIEVTPSTQSQFGHYQFNSSMKWAKLLGKPPRDIALQLTQGLQQHYPSVFAKLEVAGPGFINMWLAPDFLSQKLRGICEGDRLGIPCLGENKKVIVDFSSPNTAKEMHVGHLRSTIIGDSLARLFEFLGFDVLRLNHIGDWGTSFGMLIAYIKAYHFEVISSSLVTSLEDLCRWYKEAKVLFDEDALFKKESQMQVVALQSGEAQALQIWDVICGISRRAYQEVYDLLDIRLQERGESFYNSRLPSVVEDLEKKGLITVSDGAKCVFLEGFVNREGDPLPLIVQKTDGGYNYETTDLAALRHRVDEEEADHIIYVTDAGQALHFQMVFNAACKAGWVDSQKTQLDHVPFGMVLRSDGKKFRTRSGETFKLIDLLQEACQRARAILEERKDKLLGEDLDVMAQKIGLGAVKYADLSSHRIGDYVFSYDKMLQFEGNTATFLMYSYVRILSIQKKVGVVVTEENLTLEGDGELTLGLKLLQFFDALDVMKRELVPHRLADYLYQLAETFNAFFRDCRVEGDPRQFPRLVLCDLTARTLKQGLELLGIQVVNRM